MLQLTTEFSQSQLYQADCTILHSWSFRLSYS